MKKLTALLWFHKKIAIPAMAVSLVMALFALTISMQAFLYTIGIGYLLCAPLFHFMTYELRRSREYYFYYNYGFSRVFLWATTIISAIVVALIFRFV